jgi:hypothetical protein
VSLFRTGSFIVKMVLLNVSFLLMLWLAILEKPERVRALVVLLPIEILLNVVIVVGWRRFRSKVSTLTLIYICGMIYVLIRAFHNHDWWILWLTPLSLGLIYWSYKAHLKSQLR